MDQGEAALHITPPAAAFLEQNKEALTGAGIYPQIVDGNAYWAPRQRDAMEAALGRDGLARPTMQVCAVITRLRGL